ncbi:MAG: hypothetical protein AMXMBFR33_40600 [Candidatus Xenobia bacterium]|jgi:hypothetical protein
MRNLLLFTFMLFALVGTASAQVLTVDSNYRIVTLKPDEHGFDIQLVEERDPHDAQNWVYFKLETKIYQEIIRDDGSRKVFELTPQKFFKLAKVGDIVRVQGGRDWDMSIAAYKIWLAPVKDGVIDPSLLKP